MGIHPLLLAPFARFAAIPHPDYRKAMSSRVGSRPFVS
jgi:hypothetical protein